MDLYITEADYIREKRDEIGGSEQPGKDASFGEQLTYGITHSLPVEEIKKCRRCIESFDDDMKFHAEKTPIDLAKDLKISGCSRYCFWFEYFLLLRKRKRIPYIQRSYKSKARLEELKNKKH